MDVGIAAQEGAHRRCEGQPASTRAWRNPRRVISTGSPAVRILVSGLLSWPGTGCGAVVFSDPVGPQTKNRPYGLELIDRDRFDAEIRAPRRARREC